MPLTEQMKEYQRRNLKPSIHRQFTKEQFLDLIKQRATEHFKFRLDPPERANKQALKQRMIPFLREFEYKESTDKPGVPFEAAFNIEQVADDLCKIVSIPIINEEPKPSGKPGKQKGQKKKQANAADESKGSAEEGTDKEGAGQPDTGKSLQNLSALPGPD